jgi:CO/xanthine dehydrogenase FAD-binding subunit
MQPAEFEYFAPGSIDEAAKLLADSDDRRIIAGGQSLVAAMNLRLARPSALIDLRRIPGLDAIELDAEKVRIAARVTHAELIRSPQLRERLPLLAMAGTHISHATVRERGTFVGSLALADPAAEWPAVFLALAGTARAVSVRGERKIQADSFFVSHYTTALAPDEIMTHVELPLMRPQDRYGFSEFARQRGSFALALVAARIEVDAAGRVVSARIALGGCGSRPRLVELPDFTGSIPTAQSIEGAARKVNAAVSQDIHASGEDRRQIVAAMITRCVTAACGISPGQV